MASATDIITYIGVPLAVLGVLPILYTSFFSLLTLRAIRKLLLRNGHLPATSSGSLFGFPTRRRNGRQMRSYFWRPVLLLLRSDDRQSQEDEESNDKDENEETVEESIYGVVDDEDDTILPTGPLLSSTGSLGGRGKTGFTLRASPITTLIELELPLHVILPLPRSHTEYWKLNTTNRSRLPGGGYTTFNWRKMVVGRKLIRVQYMDEVREPPAEVDFESLVRMLLDLGARPERSGWESLRRAGLWTPGGTVLLRAPNPSSTITQQADDKLPITVRRRTDDWVLRTTVPDESDGVLSLSCQWKKIWNSGRGISSLPPGYGRLEQPQPRDPEDETIAGKIALMLRTWEQGPSESFLFEVSGGHNVREVRFEHNNIETGPTITLWDQDEPPSKWFTCTAAALIASKQHVGLWRFAIPETITTFSKSTIIPCGVMVILNLLAEEDTPAWSTPESVEFSPNPAERFHRRVMDRHRKIQLENAMPEAQAREARSARLREELWQQQDDLQADRLLRQRRDEKRLRDALASPRLNNRAVAEACLAWLIDQKRVPENWTVEALAEAVLYLMAVDHHHQQYYHHSQQQQQQQKDTDAEPKASTPPSSSSTAAAQRISTVLNEWLSWSQNGVGLSIGSQVEYLREHREEFCWAASLVCILQQHHQHHDSGSKSMGRVNEDMMECMKVWQRVRLG